MADKSQFAICCKCNQTGQCKQCTCVKAKKQCQDCLPSCLGKCQNSPLTTIMTTSEFPVTHQPEQKSEDELSPATVDTPTRSTDPFPIYPSTIHQPFTWGSRPGLDFTQALNTTYKEVIHWRRNCFSVPFGKVGRDFVNELF